LEEKTKRRQQVPLVSGNNLRKARSVAIEQVVVSQGLGLERESDMFRRRRHLRSIRERGEQNIEL